MTSKTISVWLPEEQAKWMANLALIAYVWEKVDQDTVSAFLRWCISLGIEQLEQEYRRRQDTKEV